CRPMPAQVKNGRRWLWKNLGQVEVGRDVKTGQRLEMQLLHRELLVFDLAGDDGLEVAALQLGRQAEHLEQFSTIAGAHRDPIVERFDFRQATLRKANRLHTKIF